MKKLGIYLSGSPKCGGTYSYNKTILDSLINLVKIDPNFELVVYYLDPFWEKYLSNYNLNIKFVKESFFSKVISRASRMLKLPVLITRYINQRFSPLCRLMQAENCKLWFFPSQDSISFLFPLPSIVAIHDLMHRYESTFPEVGNKKEYAIREYVYSNMTKWCKAIFVDSLVGKEQVCESYSENTDKIFILPYVAGQLFNVNYVAPKKFNEKYNLPNKYLFYPAQFWLHKNHLNLLQAFNLIKNEFPDLHLVFVGSDKNALDLIKQKIQDLKLNERVNIFGFVDEQDMPEFYRQAIAMVMPTFFGPTNIPPLEAFQMSCPVLISEIYGMPAQLGNAAVYFNPNSPKDIADKIRLILTNSDFKMEKITFGLEQLNNWNQKKFYELFNSHIFSII